MLRKAGRTRPWNMWRLQTRSAATAMQRNDTLRAGGKLDWSVVAPPRVSRAGQELTRLLTPVHHKRAARARAWA